jgi:octaprenyl-diphosphate synthase
LFNLREILGEKLEFINGAVEEVDVSSVHSILGVPTRYAIAGGGKRLRPIICTLCAEVVGGDYRDTRDAFLALELIHNGTLVHDDIIDEDLFRRGTPSAHLKFGVKRAVLTGDVLLSMGLKYAARTKKTVVIDWLSETALKMIQGVALQTFFRRRVIPEAEYLKINYLKSGSLFEAAAALGGIMGSDDVEAHGALAEFGRDFGNAYQIRDDICGVFSENRDDDLTRNDLLNGDISLPLIYALGSEAISEADRLWLLSVYLGEMKRVDLAEVQRIYEETGALERSVEMMKEFAEMSRGHVEGFESTDAKELLNQMLDQYYKNFSPGLTPKIII